MGGGAFLEMGFRDWRDVGAALGGEWGDFLCGTLDKF